MTKALMVNTATDLFGGADGSGSTNANVPTQIQGWGRINLGSLLDNTARDLVDQSERLIASGTSRSRYYTIASAAKPLRVSLVWTDPPGPTIGNSYINDLDLEVSAGGETYKGNVFSLGRSIPGGTADPRNNVENVFLPPGLTGPVKVKVLARNIAGDGIPGNADTTDQDYALVVSNVNPPVASLPVLVNAGETITPLGDNDSFLEPGEPFNLALRLKNVGNLTATSISGTLSAPTNEAAISVGTSTWPNIHAGASRLNTTQFRGTVRNSVSCGDLVDLKVTIASNGGAAAAIPVSLQTGRLGPLQTFTATDVPKSIPDNNPSGATSVVTLAGGGIISSVEVTIGSLTHTFDSDLQIDLTSPQGTTVRLFDRNGGSGDNLVNTVFSDAAATAISAGVAPFTGTFLPAQPLSAFKGQPASGNWTLTVRDAAAQDTGTLNAWSISRSRFVCN
jgi:subtilisin-like proprotein convertase family protein